MADIDEPMYKTATVGNNTIVYASGPPANLSNQCVIRRKEQTAQATRFDNVTTNTTVTNGFSEWDRDFFRPETAIPTQPTAIIAACMQAYDQFGIVRNIIDMMADFTVKGIDIVNKSAKAQQFAKDWFKMINGKDRAERIAHMLYLAGTVVIERKNGKIPDEYKKPMQPKLRHKNPLPAGRVPISYTIFNPKNLIVPYDSSATSNVDIGSYSIMNYLPSQMQKGGAGPMTMPRSWLNNNGEDLETVQLDAKKHIMLFYKRSDHQILPKPLTYPLLKTLRNLNKLIQCDESALDGAVSKTTLWRLGYINEKEPEKSIFPTSDGLARLSEMLAQSPNGGARDLVWGPELDFKETGTDIHHFLGKEKYIPTIDAINSGYGVPSSLTGGQASSGFTNNVVSMRTLSERLEYGRNVLIAFFEFELEIIRDAMGFRHPFKVTFDQPTLTDEVGEKRLLIELVDRGIVSEEFVRERFGAIPEIETGRAKREMEARKGGQMPAKAGPFYLDSQQKAFNERTFVTTGVLTPSQVGLNYEDPKPGELTTTGMPPGEQAKQVEKLAKLKTKNKQGSVDDPTKLAKKGKKGRPKGSDDVVQRKKKRVVPFGKGSTLAEFIVKVQSAKATIEEIIKPAYIASKGKSNLRQLKDEEAQELEQIIYSTLYSFSDYNNVTDETIGAALDNLQDLPQEINEEITESLSAFDGPSMDVIRQVKLMVIATNKFGVNNSITEDDNEN